MTSLRFKRNSTFTKRPASATQSFLAATETSVMVLYPLSRIND